MHLLLILALVSSLVLASPCEEAKKDILNSVPLTSNNLLPLPFDEETQFEIAWGFGPRRYRFYRNGGAITFFKPNSMELHRGVDFRVAPGTSVYALRPGIVSTKIYQRGLGIEYVVDLQEVDSNGKLTNRIWSYVHMDGDRVPSRILEAEKNNTIVNAGTKLGEVKEWLFGSDIPPQIDVSDNVLFHHLDFGLTVDGKKCNLMSILDYEDTVPPTVKKVYRTLDGSVVIEMFDQTNSGNNQVTNPFRLHDFHRIELKVSEGMSVIYSKVINGPDFVDRITDEHRKIFPEEVLTAEGKFVMEGDVHARRFFVNLLSNDEIQLPEQFELDIDVIDVKGNKAVYRYSSSWLNTYPTPRTDEIY